MLGIYGSARELDDSARAVASIPGVKDVRLRILLGEVDPPGFAAWLSGRILRRSEARQVGDRRPADDCHGRLLNETGRQGILCFRKYHWGAKTSQRVLRVGLL